MKLITIISVWNAGVTRIPFTGASDFNWADTSFFTINLQPEKRENDNNRIFI